MKSKENEREIITKEKYSLEFVKLKDEQKEKEE